MNSITVKEKETFYEYQYAVRHKPTKMWVDFVNDDLEMTIVIMKLVDFKECTILKVKRNLETFLRISVFNGVTNYGNENFLEFELVKIKTTYTIEP
jgi:hypothetical protein